MYVVLSGINSMSKPPELFTNISTLVVVLVVSLVKIVESINGTRGNIS